MTTSASPAPPFARAVGAVLGLAALLTAMIVSASPASAHARLESSSPADGSTLTATPPEIMLRFNEPIKEGLNQVTVKTGSTEVADGDVEIEGNSVYQPVKSSMKSGKYTVSYKVVSADGHPVSGTFSFTYEPPEGDTGAGGDPSASTSSSTSASSTSGSSSSSSPTQSESSSTSGESSESPAEPSGSDSESPSSATEPSSTSAPSESSSASEEPSESTEPSATADDSGEDSATDQESTSDESTSPWWWALAAAALVVVLGGLALLVRGRRDSTEDEDGPEDDGAPEDWRE